MQCKEVVNPCILVGLSAKIPSLRDEKSWGQRDGIGDDANPSALVARGLRVVCGTNTTFQKVSSGYGLFSPRDLRKKVTELNVTDWGITEFYKSDDSKIHRYFL